MDAEHPTSSSHLLGRVAATLLALLVLYALSVGPAIYLEVKLKIDFKVLDRFYAPLVWAIDHTQLDKPYYTYVSWWLRLAGEHPNF